MQRPLDNVTVVVTRAKDQAGDFAALLKEKGASVILFPTIEFREPDDKSVIDGAIKDIYNAEAGYDWIIFTSANGVRFFVKRLCAHSKDIETLSGIKVGAVGPKTAALLEEYGVSVELIPEDYSAEGLIAGLQKIGIRGKKILIPRAKVGRAILPNTLNDNGAEVTLAPVYETVAAKGNDKAALVESLRGDGDTVITFTSGSTTKNFFSLFSDEEIRGFINRVKIAVISPITEKVVNGLGYKVDIMPESYTAKDLADAIANQYNL